MKVQPKGTGGADTGQQPAPTPRNRISTIFATEASGPFVAKGGALTGGDKGKRIDDCDRVWQYLGSEHH